MAKARRGETHSALRSMQHSGHGGVCPCVCVDVCGRVKIAMSSVRQLVTIACSANQQNRGEVGVRPCGEW